MAEKIPLYVIGMLLGIPEQDFYTVRERADGRVRTEVGKPIRYDEAFSDAPSYGKTIFEFAPTSRGAEDYRELVRRITDAQAVA